MERKPLPTGVVQRPLEGDAVTADEVEGVWRQRVAEAFDGGQAGRRLDPGHVGAGRLQHGLRGRGDFGADAVAGDQDDRCCQVTAPWRGNPFRTGCRARRRLSSGGRPARAKGCVRRIWRRPRPRTHEYVRPGLYLDRPKRAPETRKPSASGAPGATEIKPRANVLVSPGTGDGTHPRTWRTPCYKEPSPHRGRTPWRRTFPPAGKPSWPTSSPSRTSRTCNSSSPPSGRSTPSTRRRRTFSTPSSTRPTTRRRCCCWARTPTTARARRTGSASRCGPASDRRRR